MILGLTNQEESKEKIQEKLETMFKRKDSPTQAEFSLEPPKIKSLLDLFKN